MNRDEYICESADSRITRYALDEMNQMERAEFQQRLAHSPELCAEAIEIEEMAAALRCAFENEANQSAAPAIPPVAREKIVALPQRPAWLVVNAAVAASVIALLTWQFWTDRLHSGAGKRTTAANVVARAVVVPTRDESLDTSTRSSLSDIASVAYHSRAIEQSNGGVFPQPGSLRFNYAAYSPAARASVNPGEAGRFNFKVGYEL